MRIFDFTFKSLAGGIGPEERGDKKQPRFSECHNLEPVNDDYVVHEMITDLNADDIEWE